MALIKCDNCGKTYSDTVSSCIHCGTPKKTTSIDGQEVEKKTTEKSITYYRSLDKKRQKELVYKFWKNDKAAGRYKEKLTMCNEMLYFSFFITAVIFILNLAFERVLIVYAKNFIPWVIFRFLGVLIIVFLIFLFLYCLIHKAILRKKIKQFAYKKRFEIYLREKENIHYDVALWDAREKDYYDQIDVEKIKL